MFDLKIYCELEYILKEENVELFVEWRNNYGNLFGEDFFCRPKRKKEDKEKLEKSNVDGIEINGKFNKLPNDLIEQSLLLSDLFEMNEICSLDLLINSCSESIVNDGNATALNSVTIFYETFHFWIRTLNILLINSNGHIWKSDLKNENLIEEINFFLLEIFNSKNLFKHLIQLIGGRCWRKEQNRLLEFRALGEKSHRILIRKFYEETTSSICESILLFSSQFLLTSERFFQLLNFISNNRNLSILLNDTVDLNDIEITSIEIEEKIIENEFQEKLFQKFLPYPRTFYLVSSLLMNLDLNNFCLSSQIIFDELNYNITTTTTSSEEIRLKRFNLSRYLLISLNRSPLFVLREKMEFEEILKELEYFYENNLQTTNSNDDDDDDDEEDELDSNETDKEFIRSLLEKFNSNTNFIENLELKLKFEINSNKTNKFFMNCVRPLLLLQLGNLLRLIGTQSNDNALKNVVMEMNEFSENEEYFIEMAFESGIFGYFSDSLIPSLQRMRSDNLTQIHWEHLILRQFHSIFISLILFWPLKLRELRSQCDEEIYSRNQMTQPMKKSENNEDFFNESLRCDTSMIEEESKQFDDPHFLQFINAMISFYNYPNKFMKYFTDQFWQLYDQILEYGMEYSSNHFMFNEINHSIHSYQINFSSLTSNTFDTMLNDSTRQFSIMCRQHKNKLTSLFQFIRVIFHNDCNENYIQISQIFINFLVSTIRSSFAAERAFNMLTTRNVTNRSNSLSFNRLVQALVSYWNAFLEQNIRWNYKSETFDWYENKEEDDDNEWKDENKLTNSSMSITDLNLINSMILLLYRIISLSDSAKFQTVFWRPQTTIDMNQFQLNQLLYEELLKNCFSSLQLDLNEICRNSKKFESNSFFLYLLMSMCRLRETPIQLKECLILLMKSFLSNSIQSFHSNDQLDEQIEINFLNSIDTIQIYSETIKSNDMKSIRMIMKEIIGNEEHLKLLNEISIIIWKELIHHRLICFEKNEISSISKSIPSFHQQITQKILIANKKLLSFGVETNNNYQIHHNFIQLIYQLVFHLSIDEILMIFQNINYSQQQQQQQQQEEEEEKVEEDKEIEEEKELFDLTQFIDRHVYSIHFIQFIFQQLFNIINCVVAIDRWKICRLLLSIWIRLIHLGIRQIDEENEFNGKKSIDDVFQSNHNISIISFLLLRMFYNSKELLTFLNDLLSNIVNFMMIDSHEMNHSRHHLNFCIVHILELMKLSIDNFHLIRNNSTRKIDDELILKRLSSDHLYENDGNISIDELKQQTDFNLYNSFLIQQSTGSSSILQSPTSILLETEIISILLKIIRHFHHTNSLAVINSFQLIDRFLNCGNDKMKIFCQIVRCEEFGNEDLRRSIVRILQINRRYKIDDDSIQFSFTISRPFNEKISNELKLFTFSFIRSLFQQHYRFRQKILSSKSKFPIKHMSIGHWLLGFSSSESLSSTQLSEVAKLKINQTINSNSLFKNLQLNQNENDFNKILIIERNSLHSIIELVEMFEEKISISLNFTHHNWEIILNCFHLLYLAMTNHHQMAMASLLQFLRNSNNFILRHLIIMKHLLDNFQNFPQNQTFDELFRSNHIHFLQYVAAVLKLVIIDIRYCFQSSRLTDLHNYLNLLIGNDENFNGKILLDLWNSIFELNDLDGDVSINSVLSIPIGIRLKKNLNCLNSTILNEIIKEKMLNFPQNTSKNLRENYFVQKTNGRKDFENKMEMMKRCEILRKRIIKKFMRKDENLLSHLNEEKSIQFIFNETRTNFNKNSHEIFDVELILSFIHNRLALSKNDNFIQLSENEDDDDIELILEEDLNLLKEILLTENYLYRLCFFQAQLFFEWRSLFRLMTQSKVLTESILSKEIHWNFILNICKKSIESLIEPNLENGRQVTNVKCWKYLVDRYYLILMILDMIQKLYLNEKKSDLIISSINYIINRLDGKENELIDERIELELEEFFGKFKKVFGMNSNDELSSISIQMNYHEISICSPMDFFQKLFSLFQLLLQLFNGTNSEHHQQEKCYVYLIFMKFTKIVDSLNLFEEDEEKDNDDDDNDDNEKKNLLKKDLKIKIERKIESICRSQLHQITNRYHQKMQLILLHDIRIYMKNSQKKSMQIFLLDVILFWIRIHSSNLEDENDLMNFNYLPVDGFNELWRKCLSEATFIILLVDNIEKNLKEFSKEQHPNQSLLLHFQFLLLTTIASFSEKVNLENDTISIILSTRLLSIIRESTFFNSILNSSNDDNELMKLNEKNEIVRSILLGDILRLFKLFSVCLRYNKEISMIMKEIVLNSPFTFICQLRNLCRSISYIRSLDINVANNHLWILLKNKNLFVTNSILDILSIIQHSTTTTTTTIFSHIFEKKNNLFEYEKNVKYLFLSITSNRKKIEDILGKRMNEICQYFSRNSTKKIDSIKFHEMIITFSLLIQHLSGILMSGLKFLSNFHSDFSHEGFSRRIDDGNEHFVFPFLSPSITNIDTNENLNSNKQKNINLGNILQSVFLNYQFHLMIFTFSSHLEAFMNNSMDKSYNENQNQTYQLIIVKFIDYLKTFSHLQLQLQNTIEYHLLILWQHLFYFVENESCLNEILLHLGTDTNLKYFSSIQQTYGREAIKRIEQHLRHNLFDEGIIDIKHLRNYLRNYLDQILFPIIERIKNKKSKLNDQSIVHILIERIDGIISNKRNLLI